MPEETKSWPFSSYDFFGYLMPGLIFLTSLLGWCCYADFEWASNFSISAIRELKLGDSLLIIFLGFTSSYFAGHLIGAISHILYDRMIIRNIIGYPMQRLLNVNFEPNLNTRTVYLLFFCCLGALMIIPGLCELLHYFIYESDVSLTVHCIPFDKSMWWWAFIERVIFSVITTTIFILFMLRLLKMSQIKHNSQENKKLNSFFKFVDFFLRSLFLTPLKKLTGTDTIPEKPIINAFKQKLQKYGMQNSIASSDVFWIASIELRKDPAIDRKLTNWLNLYGCLRNYSCAFFTLALIIAANHWYKIIWLHQVTNLRGSRILLLSLVISFILFLRYWIIYYSYFSKYVVRAFACYEK